MAVSVTDRESVQAVEREDALTMAVLTGAATDVGVAAANAVGLPLLFLSETFVPPSLLPGWFRPLIALSPLTYFARATRASIVPAGQTGAGDVVAPLAVLAVLSVVAFAAGAVALPVVDD